MSEAPRYSWTQSCCLHCWYDANPSRDPIQLIEQYRESETCVYCGKACRDGIFVRIDPAEAPHPTATKDD